MAQPRNMLHDGRNIIPVTNSDGKCLIENWVEDRAVKHLEPKIDLDKGPWTSRLQVLLHGNKGLLTTDLDAKAEDLTTMRVMYKPPVVDTTRTVGFQKELMQKKHAQDICNEWRVINPVPRPERTDYRSTKMKDYDFQFTPQKMMPTRDHNYRTEQPVTFWTEHKDNIHGVTQIKTRDTVFRRNDSFTKPISEWWEEPKPYDLENYPKM